VLKDFFRNPHGATALQVADRSKVDFPVTGLFADQVPTCHFADRLTFQIKGGTFWENTFEKR